jgi:hypothetical protein
VRRSRAWSRRADATYLVVHQDEREGRPSVSAALAHNRERLIAVTCLLDRDTHLRDARAYSQLEHEVVLDVKHHNGRRNRPGVDEGALKGTFFHAGCSHGGGRGLSDRS